MSSTVTLNPASATKSAQIAALSRTEVEHGLPWTWTPARVKRCIADRSTMVVAANEGPRLAGFAIMEYGDSRAHLCLLAVNSEFRKQGLGSRLVHWLEQTATVAGIFDIDLEVRKSNQAARDFYLALGYREHNVLVGYYSGQEDAVRMSHDLRVSNA